MLPEGFEWREYIDGPALYLGPVIVANVTPIDNGDCRVCLRSYATPRYVFLGRDAAIRYCEAWARKWEGRIRQEAEWKARPV